MIASSTSVVGALIGLCTGLAAYVIALGVIGFFLRREGAEGGEMPGLDFVTARFAGVRRGLAAVSFLVLPALGFALGATLGAGSEASP